MYLALPDGYFYTDNFGVESYLHLYKLAGASDTKQNKAGKSWEVTDIVSM